MSPEEIFNKLVDLEFFHVDDLGKIWRQKEWTRGRNIREVPLRRAERLTTEGYLQVVFNYEGVRYCCTAGRLVYWVCRGDIPDGMEVNHKNGVKSDNDPRNLELVTPSGNSTHAYATGLKTPPRRPLNRLVKLDPAVAATIRRQRKADGLTQQELADQHGVSQTTIGRILRGEAWPDERLRSSE